MIPHSQDFGSNHLSKIGVAWGHTKSKKQKTKSDDNNGLQWSRRSSNGKTIGEDRSAGCHTFAKARLHSTIKLHNENLNADIDKNKEIINIALFDH